MKKLKLKNDNVLNIYQYGSRLWGDFRPDSDYDYIIVLKNHNKPKEGIHIENIDATIYSLEGFVEELRQNKFLPIVVSMMWKDRSVVLERQPFDSARYFNGEAFKTAVLQEVDRDLKMIEKMIAKGNIEKSDKIKKYCLRMCQLAAQALNPRGSERNETKKVEAAAQGEDGETSLDEEEEVSGNKSMDIDVVREIRILYTQIQNVWLI